MKARKAQAQSKARRAQVQLKARRAQAQLKVEDSNSGFRHHRQERFASDKIFI